MASAIDIESKQLKQLEPKQLKPFCSGTNSMILVIGAAGKTGRAIVQALLAKGASVRGLVRRAEQTAVLHSLGVSDVVVGDVRETAVLTQALHRVQAIYHICPNMQPDEVEIGQNVITAAQKAGISHFVYHSVLHPQTEKMPHHWHKLRVEEMLFESGLPFTILQPSVYMQNILANWQTILDAGLYQTPYPITTRLSLVDVADVAAAAAIVLTEPGHTEATYELVGPQALSQEEVAQVLSQEIGRFVQAAELPLEIWVQQSQKAGLGIYQRETLVKMFKYYAHFGLIGNGQVLRWLLKRPSTTLATFIQKVIAHGNPHLS